MSTVLPKSGRDGGQGFPLRVKPVTRDNGAAAQSVVYYNHYLEITFTTGRTLNPIVGHGHKDPLFKPRSVFVLMFSNVKIHSRQPGYHEIDLDGQLPASCNDEIMTMFEPGVPGEDRVFHSLRKPLTVLYEEIIFRHSFEAYPA